MIKPDKLVLSIILISIPLFCYNQQKGFTLGIIVNANGIHIEDENEIFWQASKGKIWGGGGLSSGIYVKRFIHNSVYLKSEFRYICKGSNYEYVNRYGTISNEVLRLRYAEIPFEVGYQLKTSRNYYFFESGIAYARLFSSRLNIEEFASRNEITDIRNFKNSDVSWTGSLKFPVNKNGKQNLLLGLRFSYSLISIHEYYRIKNLNYGIQLDYLLGK